MIKYKYIDLKRLERIFFIAGEDIYKNQVVCINTDNKVYKAIANNADKMPAVGVALNDAIKNEGVKIIDNGEILTSYRDSNLIPGKVVYVSNMNAGNITINPPSNSGDVQQIVGYCRNSKKVVININLFSITVG